MHLDVHPRFFLLLAPRPVCASPGFSRLCLTGSAGGRTAFSVFCSTSMSSAWAGTSMRKTFLHLPHRAILPTASSGTVVGRLQ